MLPRDSSPWFWFNSVYIVHILPIQASPTPGLAPAPDFASITIYNVDRVIDKRPAGRGFRLASARIAYAKR